MNAPRKRRRPTTDRQKDVLRAVRELTTSEGPPSAAQVASCLGITRPAATRHLRACEAKGLLSDIPKQVSSGKWALTPQADEMLTGG